MSYQHNETDEIIYWQLAENWLKTGNYSLQGTEILKSLPAYVYDRQLFHHPPLFSLLLIPFVIMKAKKLAIIISWLGHLLCIVSVALVGRSILTSRSQFSVKSNLFWIPLISITFDPLLIFISRKLWIDSLLSGLVALSVALFYSVCKSDIDYRHKKYGLIAAGIALGLAALCKLTALIVTPVIIYILITSFQTSRERWKLKRRLYSVYP
ncbi:MAG: glycosyltransferase 87 family protein [Pseudomonadota bacterium]